MSWDLKVLAEAVEAKNGREQKEIVEPLLNSAWRKLQIAKYHAIESKQLVESYFQSDEFESYNKAIRFLFERMNGDKEATKFYEDAFLSEAHVVAYSQSLHSTYDIMGQIIMHSLDITRFFKPGSNIYLSTVKSKLQQRNLGAGIVAKIGVCLQNEKFQYLRAFVNTNKHCCLIQMPYTVHAQAEKEKKSHGIKIPAFRYGETVYPEKWATDFVTGDFTDLCNDIIALGISINEYMIGK